MDNRAKQLLKTLDDITSVLKNCGKVLALIGLGSIGAEFERLDQYSDLDFFVIAKPDQKRFFLDSLAWLEAVQPVVFSFMNTADGYKILLANEVFCEMAVFEREELAGIPYTHARVIWQEPVANLVVPQSSELPDTADRQQSKEWLLGEILSNLYVGLGRFQRGEKLTAARFIQGYAVDRILELTPHIEEAQSGLSDPFDAHRRFEDRYPTAAALLPEFMQGYERSPECAHAILDFLESHFTLNQPIKEAIGSLAQ